MHGESVGFNVTPSVALAYLDRRGLPLCLRPDGGAGRGARGRAGRDAGGVRGVDWEAYLDAVAPAVGLPVDPGWRGGIVRFLGLAAEMAATPGGGRARRRPPGPRCRSCPAGGRAMTDPTGPWASATEIADAVSKGSVRAVAVAEAALARIGAANPVLGAYTDVTAERALAMAAAVDEAVAAGRPVGAARRRAVRGQEPLRRRRPADAGRVADQPRAGAGGGRCGAGAADGGGGRGPARHAQHGRVRLRLHRRERP